jgi:hypothetical protein
MKTLSKFGYVKVSSIGKRGKRMYI